MSKQVTGLLADIYRSGPGAPSPNPKERGPNFSNDGISARYLKVLVVGDGIDGPTWLEHAEGRPVVQIIPGNLPGTYKAVPVLGWEAAAEIRGKTVGPMFGGCFVYTSDSRFSQVFGGPVPLHDRYETPTEYESLSR